MPIARVMDVQSNKARAIRKDGASEIGQNIRPCTPNYEGLCPSNQKLASIIEAAINRHYRASKSSMEVRKRPMGQVKSRMDVI